jgi:hypothetical protein
MILRDMSIKEMVDEYCWRRRWMRGLWLLWQVDELCGRSFGSSWQEEGPASLKTENWKGISRQWSTLPTTYTYHPDYTNKESTHKPRRTCWVKTVHTSTNIGKQIIMFTGLMQFWMPSSASDMLSQPQCILKANNNLFWGNHIPCLPYWLWSWT